MRWDRRADEATRGWEAVRGGDEARDRWVSVRVMGAKRLRRSRWERGTYEHVVRGGVRPMADADWNHQGRITILVTSQSLRSYEQWPGKASTAIRGTAIRPNRPIRSSRLICPSR